MDRVGCSSSAKKGEDFHLTNKASGGNIYKWCGMLSTISRTNVTPLTVISFGKN